MESLGNAPLEAIETELPGQLWAVGGGKGGVGKSVISCMFAHSLGQNGHKVILVDADLGGANLHTLAGIRMPKFTLEDFLLHRVRELEGVLLDTPFANVRLLAGGYEVASLANPNYGQKSRIIRALQGLKADYIIVDLGAGTGLNTLDFFLACSRRIVVVAPQPTSVQNAYGFVKSALYRALGRSLSKNPDALRIMTMADASRGEHSGQTMEQNVAVLRAYDPECAAVVQDILDNLTISLLVNMANDRGEERTGDVVAAVCSRYLGLKADSLGTVRTDPAIHRWVSRMDPAQAFGGETGFAAAALRVIANRIAPPTSLHGMHAQCSEQPRQPGRAA